MHASSGRNSTLIHCFFFQSCLHNKPQFVGKAWSTHHLTCILQWSNCRGVKACTTIIPFQMKYHSSHIFWCFTTTKHFYSDPWRGSDYSNKHLLIRCYNNGWLFICCYNSGCPFVRCYEGLQTFSTYTYCSSIQIHSIFYKYRQTLVHVHSIFYALVTS
jgi:hypothetical protein